MEKPLCHQRSLSCFVYARESGTTARFSIAIAGGIGGRTHRRGGEKVEREADGRARESLKDLGGAEIYGFSLPLTVKGPIKPGRVSVDASKSSQFVSGLLLLGGRRSG